MVLYVLRITHLCELFCILYDKKRIINLVNQKIIYYSGTGESGSSIRLKIHRTGIELKEVYDYEELFKELTSEQYQICVIRCEKIDDKIIDLIRKLKKDKPNLGTIISANSGFVEDAIKVIKSGADDYFVGNLADPLLIESIVRYITDYGGRSNNHNVSKEKFSENELVFLGQSSAASEIRSAISLIAKSQTTVLLTGESGTGKEVVARNIHLQSNRADKPFVALNCATLPRDVIENELFGHERGAFTGAIQKKMGCFELAHGGTILLDEIGEMSIETQAKLLRVIETQKFRRLGGKEEINVDVRIIAATNKNIVEALKTKEMREDLYYRLSVIEIYIPPLRERREDINILLDYYLKVFAKKYELKYVPSFDEEALEILNKYDWPGNVRELKNVVERAIVICPHKQISPKYFPQRIQQSVKVDKYINIPIGTSTNDAEEIMILKTLESTGHNKSKAAKILGWSRKTLYNKLSAIQNKKDRNSN